MSYLKNYHQKIAQEVSRATLTQFKGTNDSNSKEKLHIKKVIQGVSLEI